ncbi:MAG TPA: hypothetical protein VJU58_14835 [Microbacterium sp.]|nr:hypothetical protein [Microbacterium sp.]
MTLAPDSADAHARRGYGGQKVAQGDVEWRRRRGLDDQPALAVVVTDEESFVFLRHAAK